MLSQMLQWRTWSIWGCHFVFSGWNIELHYLGHWTNQKMPLRITLRIKLNISRRNFFKYYSLNVIVSINSFIALNISLNTNLKYYYSQALINETLKLMRGAMIFFSKKLLGHEIFSFMVLWATKFCLKNL